MSTKEAADYLRVTPQAIHARVKAKTLFVSGRASK